MNKNVFIKSTNDSFSLKTNLFNCISDLCLFIPVFNINSSIFWGHLVTYVYKNKRTNINPLRSAGASSISSVDFVYFIKELP